MTAPIQALQRRLCRACDAAQSPRFTPHGLGRMVVGRLLRAQVDPATAASLTGHSIDVMLTYYREVTDEDRRSAAERAMLGVNCPATDDEARLPARLLEVDPSPAG